MKRKTKINDLASLKLAQVEREVELVERELSLKTKGTLIWESVLDLSFFSNKDKPGVKNLLVEHFSPITQMVSSFLINNIIKPKSKWVRKISTTLSSIVIQRYSKFFQLLFKTFLQDDQIESKSKL